MQTLTKTGEHPMFLKEAPSGYMKLARQATPQCGTDHTPLDGSGCQDSGVQEVHVCGTCAVLSGIK